MALNLGMRRDHEERAFVHSCLEEPWNGEHESDELVQLSGSTYARMRARQIASSLYLLSLYMCDERDLQYQLDVCQGLLLTIFSGW